MATLVTPHSLSQSAIACRSSVITPNSRTGLSLLSGGTATKCDRAPTSIPAACRLTRRSAEVRFATLMILPAFFREFLAPVRGIVLLLSLRQARSACERRPGAGERKRDKLFNGMSTRPRGSEALTNVPDVMS